MRRQPLIITAAIVIGLAALGGGLMLRAGAIARHNDEEAAAAAARAALPSLQAADPGIDSITGEKPMLTLWANVRKAPDLAGNFDISADMMRAVGKALQRGVSDDLKGVEIIRFAFHAEAIDRYGHDVMAPLVTLDVAMADLKAAHYAALNRGQVLNLAYSAGLGAPGAYDAIAAWCGDPARANAGFCGKVRK
jgi:hypothetical protein